MLSPDEKPNLPISSNSDFTEISYRSILVSAKSNYRFCGYDKIPWGEKFILWRHDVDFSINRAASMARIESEEGIRATYFINPRSSFYNPFEPSQAELIKKIINYGHWIGLHFDAQANRIYSEELLNEIVNCEGRWLKEAFGVDLHAFSFHNPTREHLIYENDSYGGLVNCYSSKFKKQLPYCSDSNGYWRFRRLHDVIEKADDSCLQVLTHPGWWQKEAMPPRQRVVRCIYGRADANLKEYEQMLAINGRHNLTI
jgi:hypothetical protein